MKAYDFEFYIDYNSYDVFCIYCGNYDESNENHRPIFASDEWDYYPICSECKYECTYVNLTDYGAAQQFNSSLRKAYISINIKYPFIKGYFSITKNIFVVTENCVDYIKSNIISSLQNKILDVIGYKNNEKLGISSEFIFYDDLKNNYIRVHIENLIKLSKENLQKPII